MMRDELAVMLHAALHNAVVRVRVRLANDRVVELDVLRVVLCSSRRVKLDEYAEPPVLADPPLGYEERMLVLEVDDKPAPAEVNASVVVAER